MWCGKAIAVLIVWLVTAAGGYSRAAVAESPVKLWQEPMVVPTYAVGPADRNPIFFNGRSYQGAKGPVYPYPMFDKLSDQKQDRTYQAIYLENKYVKFSVLPELGGRVFRGTDKTNGYDFFYRQHVIKPALIGMIGAWISGGVEWNVPHHHRASTFMPVDYRLVDNPDGSKTVWVGETEWRHRMRWIVGLTLRPDKSYLEATIKVLNRTSLPHTLLCFANVAVSASADYQVIFPPSTEYGTQHGKREFVAWPVGGGRYGGLDRTGVDLSWWKNHPTPVSIFAWNYEDDFFGGYDHGREAGVAHVADHYTVPGKKFFEFANGEEGRMWDRILTDVDGPYLELMAGAYSDNQPDYSWIQPYEVKVVKQSWYPIRQLGGMKKANLDGAVNLDVTADHVAKFAFNTTSAYRGAKVVLQARHATVFEEAIDISPEKPFAKEVRLPEGVQAEEVRVALLAGPGREVISYQPVKRRGAALPKPVEPPPSPKEIKTSEELYLAGLRLEQFHSPALEPYPYYEEALRRDPGDSRVNMALAILYLKRGMWPEAERHLNTAVERLTHNYTSPKDGEAYYYLGVVHHMQERWDAAADAFEKACWSQAWYGAGHYARAEVAVRRGELTEALEHVDRSIAANALNTKALDLKAVLLRGLGRLAEAAALAKSTQAIDPLDFWAGNEQYLAVAAMGRADEAAEVLAELKERMRGAAQAYLELAVDYGNCGRYDDAIGVLTRYVETAPEKDRIYPEIYYWLGYYWLRKGDEHRSRALECFRLGAQMPPDCCFPFRLESIDLFERAMKFDQADARAPYYLGNLLFDLQPERAIAAWEASRDRDDRFAIVQRNLGLAYARVRNCVGPAIACLEKAVACNPHDPRYYAELDSLYEAGGVACAKRLDLLEKNHAVVAQRDDALLREIRLLLLAGRYDRAIELLDGHHFHLWEGESGIHDVYVDAHLLRGQQHLRDKKYAEAMEDCEACFEYPDRFETGRPSRGDDKDPQIHFVVGTVCEAAGRRDEATKHFQQAIGRRHGPSEPRYYQALSYRKLGQEAQAVGIFDDLIRAGNERLSAKAEVDFFAKFGDKQSDNVRRAAAHYLVALGHFGKGDSAAARRSLEEAQKLNPSHLGVQTLLAEMR